MRFLFITLIANVIVNAVRHPSVSLVEENEYGPIRVETLSDEELVALANKWGWPNWNDIGKNIINHCKKELNKAKHWVKETGKNLANGSSKLVGKIKKTADKEGAKAKDWLEKNS